MKLFIDTTNWQLCLILIDDNNNIVEEFIQKNTKKISDITMTNIVSLLEKHNLKLNQISNFYVTRGPGSYTGVRVGLTIVKTLKTLNNNINVFLIDSLKLQAANKKSISLLDARSNKWFCGVYDKNKIIKEPYLIDENELKDLEKKHSDFHVIKDYENIDFKVNVLKCLEQFEKVKEVNEIIPIYIKNFI
ncbi:tRNA (adenosine(37)-N6)-threonylcarbamoyltransferase complex dimerization subunit type 1 TsaB [Mesoplasma chauliocola]|uniref:tRNA (Adenosine(37)-N6)-threonylcarbamoyltransferase complex dimerization subunit type 1 TsaB n=1 Tax=Mesoplasma chauliocola TaxID=216427 RepID=A0A249SNS1_9MOLU|nr:tRNA (adenosine(37)-N6)-threonylcarbamoyltransferase complex dimerization subunit type 1 TsaB [Mesoplasma chauliocola]ASZ09267.1 tRNA (adenosine(37)-N6)-threonylcarbamoyltransferase complex dimerization subunit type 1 TsaB [Mesoplasma chauliocola]